MPDGHRNLNFFFSQNNFIGSFYEIKVKEAYEYDVLGEIYEK